MKVPHFRTHGNARGEHFPCAIALARLSPAEEMARACRKLDRADFANVVASLEAVGLVTVQSGSVYPRACEHCGSGDLFIEDADGELVVTCATCTTFGLPALACPQCHRTDAFLHVGEIVCPDCIFDTPTMVEGGAG